MKNDAPEWRLSRSWRAVLIGLARMFAGLGCPGLLAASEAIVCDQPPLIARAPEAHAQLGWSLHASNGWLAAGAFLDDMSGKDSGAVALYRNPQRGARSDQEVRPSDLRPGDQFGASVSISGEWLAVGAPAGDGRVQDSGAVYLFHYDREGKTWVQTTPKLEAADAARGDRFGFSVSLSGNTLVVGAPDDSDRGSLSGSAYVFELQEGAWKQTAKLVAGDGRPFDEFGSAVAVDEDENTLVVGAPFADDLGRLRNFGAAYVFRRDGSNGWSLRDPLKDKLTAGSFRDGNIQFGAAVAIRGTRIVVGAPGDDLQSRTDSGSAYAFELQGSDRIPSGPFPVIPIDPGPGKQFGTAVQIATLAEGERIVVGARFDGEGSSKAGAAYLFAKQGETWTQTRKLIRHSLGGAFGQSIATLGDQVFMGGFLEDVGPEVNAGAVAVCPIDSEPSACPTITKTDHRSTVQPGQTVTYQIDVQAGSSDATVMDPSPPDTFPSQLEPVGWCRGLNCTDFVPLPLVATVSAGNMETFLVRGRVRDEATGESTNTACVRSNGCPDICAPDTDRIQTQPPCPEILVTKDDGLTQVAPGQTAKYTIKVSNVSDCNAPAVHVTDILRPELTDVSWCDLGADPVCASPIPGNVIDRTISLAPHQSATFTATGTVLPSACGMLTNQACALLPDGSSACGDDPPDRIAQAVDLALTDPSATCGSVGYTLVITNPGPVANNVQVTTGAGTGLSPIAPADARCSIVSSNIVCTLAGVAAGAVIKIPVAFKVPDCYAVNPILAAASLGANCDPAHDQRSIAIPVVCKADLAVEKTGPSSAAPGDPLPYSVKVTNLGPDPACGVVVKDSIPPGLDVPSAPGCEISFENEAQCPIDKLPPGEAKTFDITFKVPPAAACDSKIANTARVSAGTDDPKSENNSGTATTTVACVPVPAGVHAFCDGVSGLLTEGSVVTFYFRLVNGGPADQGDNPGDEFTDVLPAGLTLVSASADSGTASTAGNTATWNGSIPAGGTVNITVTATINLGTLGQTICNPAEIAFDADGDGINESSREAAPACCFQVVAVPIPALSEAGLAALSLLLAGLALLRLRRRSL